METSFSFVKGCEISPKKIIEFWQNNDTTITPTDTEDKIGTASLLHPQLFIVALRQEEIVGIVWGPFDGRRGYINHFAVKRELRKKRLGTILMQKIEDEFIKMNVYKIHLFVEKTNMKVTNFYSKLDYTIRNDLVVMSKTIRTQN